MRENSERANSQQVAVITGASRGIGAYIAQVFAEQGFRLVLGARDVASLKAMAAELQTPTLACKLDVSDPSSVRDFHSETINHFGRVDYLICNAGIGKFAAFGDFSPQDCRSMFATNVFGLFNVVSSFVDDLVETQGSLIAIGADAATRQFHGGSLYSATQAAAYSMLQSLKIEYPKLRICQIRPGRTETYFAGQMTKFDEANKQSLTPDNVAEALNFLLSLPESVELPDLVIRSRNQFTDYSAD